MTKPDTNIIDLDPNLPATDAEILAADKSVMAALLEENTSRGALRLCRILRRLELVEQQLDAELKWRREVDND